MHLRDSDRHPAVPLDVIAYRISRAKRFQDPRLREVGCSPTEEAQPILRMSRKSHRVIVGGALPREWGLRAGFIQEDWEPGTAASTSRRLLAPLSYVTTALKKYF